MAQEVNTIAEIFRVFEGMTEREEYEKLCDLINYHRKKYFVDCNPEITDQDYDVLFRRLEDFEKSHPEWTSLASPTQRVGEVLTEGFKTIEHTVPMKSLANTYSKEELQDFIDRCQKNLGHESEFSAELKMDGVAISIRYEKGVFCRAVTRGNGFSGDDVTGNVKTIESLPLKLLGEDIPDSLELRGEVFISHKIFSSLNDQRVLLGEGLWANPRNAAAGSLKLLNPKEASARHLDLVLYAIVEGVSQEKLSSQYACHALMKKWGLPVLELVEKCSSLEEIMVFANRVLEKRAFLPFDIDGIVLKVDSLQDQKLLGVTGKNPRWAVAYKFDAEVAETYIKEITVQVGRTGVLTPVAELKPVSLAGSMISRASLHNEEEVQRKDIRIGDAVYIEKGGDVIPKVVRVDFSKRGENSFQWFMPKECPSCGALLERREGEVAVRCPNTQECFDQRLRRIIYFVSKAAMDIEYMGEQVVRQLVVRGLIKKESDIFCLKAEDLLEMEGFQEKSVENLLASIEKSRNVPLHRFVMSLGIKFVGIGTAELLAKEAGNIENLSSMTEDELLQINGVGEKVAKSVVEYFQSAENCRDLRDLLDGGVSPSIVKAVENSGHAFNGKVFVLTGTLQHHTRDAASALIKERGGKVSGSVSKKTDFLLAGESPGSKLEKAKKCSVKVLSEEEFIEKLEL